MRRIPVKMWPGHQDYLEFLADLTAFTGLPIARYRQIGISVERMQRLWRGELK